MSYILDALKRAEAERERGQVPGLHAQPLDSTQGPSSPPGLPRWGWIAGGGTVLVIVAALAWRMGADANAPLPVPMLPTPAAAPAALPAETTVAMAPTTPPAAEPVQAPPPQPAVAEATAPPAPVPAAPMAPAALPEPHRAPAIVATPPTSAGPTPPVAARKEPAAPAVARVPPAAAPTDTAPAAIPLWSELPASVRQQMPAWAVTGSVYSEDASSRFIMLNGEVVKEGSQPSPGVTIERIEPKSAVLRFKGQRFRLPY
ncbi:general secretion pathway protein GspB [Ideonella sp. DXS29W]|uniref:General secretion pathway protein GspB n=1 Tax=Ideonella lacteola TaxID=2984193 RepID=A0ABU9BTZ4_9BURK